MSVREVASAFALQWERTTADDDEGVLERLLLQRGLGMLAADRNRCADCRRTPLAGERIHLYGPVIVCELCRPLRRGDPAASEVVRHCEFGQTVRVLRAA